MNILEIIKSYKSMGESIKLDTTVSGIKSINSVDLIKRNDEEFIRVKVSKSYIYYDKDGHLVLNNDSFLIENEVIVSNKCMLSVFSVDPKPMAFESGQYISCSRGTYYVFESNSRIRFLGSDGIYDLTSHDLNGYESLNSSNVNNFKSFIDSLIESTGVNNVFKDILNEGYSIVSYSPLLSGNFFRMLIDLIDYDDEIDVNNVVNYAIEIPIQSLFEYKFNIKDLKTYDELSN